MHCAQLILCSAGHVNEHFCLFAAFITADTKGKWVVCGSEDNSIFLWDLNKKEVSCILFCSTFCIVVGIQVAGCFALADLCCQMLLKCWHAS